ncbi:helix-turn-helix domain-containing protein [uncultured Phascolarctobacterium sp.]|uniref:helix-turn-helix domain-containing protein n=1 Tax=uncultured Phascolarctobacterium sp. TaxID=512296 RepID=UPI0026095FBB|nr:helix-turn-helix transcriptional regulator [uncultured Phascolarctobacterium sp.]
MTLFAARYKNIGLKIAYYRKKNGYTQAELAERIGMSAAYLGQIERGNRGNSFSLETLYQIADALEIDVNLLIKNEMLA